jgi:hypothetical protein
VRQRGRDAGERAAQGDAIAQVLADEQIAIRGAGGEVLRRQKVRRVDAVRDEERTLRADDAGEVVHLVAADADHRRQPPQVPLRAQHLSVGPDRQVEGRDDAVAPYPFEQPEILIRLLPVQHVVRAAPVGEQIRSGTQLGRQGFPIVGEDAAGEARHEALRQHEPGDRSSAQRAGRVARQAVVARVRRVARVTIGDDAQVCEDHAGGPRNWRTAARNTAS